MKPIHRLVSFVITNAAQKTLAPILIAGNAGGAFQTGRSIKFAPETPMANLFVTMLQRMALKSRASATARER